MSCDAVDDGRGRPARGSRLSMRGDLLEVEALLERGADDGVGLLGVELAVGPADGGERHEHVAPEAVPLERAEALRVGEALARWCRAEALELVARGAIALGELGDLEGDHVGVLAGAVGELEHVAELARGRRAPARRPCRRGGSSRRRRRRRRAGRPCSGSARSMTRRDRWAPASPARSPAISSSSSPSSRAVRTMASASSRVELAVGPADRRRARGTRRAPVGVRSCRATIPEL